MSRPIGINDFIFRCSECGQRNVVPAFCVTPDDEVLGRSYICSGCGSSDLELVEKIRCPVCEQGFAE